MDEKVSFFELKYLINDTFYYEVSINGYTFGQAVGICYESFLGYIMSDGMEGIVARMELLKLKMRHKVKLDENDIQSMQYIVKKSGELDWANLLSAEEIEYFEEDLDWVKEQLVNIAEC